MIRQLVAVTFTLGLAANALAQNAPTKTASEYFLQYHKTMSSAKSIEDVRPFMDADQQKEMDAAPKAEQEMGVKMISGMYAKITDIKVVKETAKGNVYTLDLTAVSASDKEAGTGTAEISKDAKGWHVDSEVWKFGGSTLTLKKKTP